MDGQTDSTDKKRVCSKPVVQSIIKKCQRYKRLKVIKCIIKKAVIGVCKNMK